MMAAGVALSTASRAMTGSSEVGAATRARILETASEMGYRPSLAGQALRSGRTYLIELEVPDHVPDGVLTHAVSFAAECDIRRTVRKAMTTTEQNAVAWVPLGS